MQCRGLQSASVQGSLWAQMERSHIQTTPHLACRVSHAVSLHPPSESPASSAVKFTHQSADTKQRNTFAASQWLPQFSFYYRAEVYSLQCGSLLQRGEFCCSIVKINCFLFQQCINNMFHNQILDQGWETLVLEGCYSACFTTISDATADNDYVDRVCSVNQKLEHTNSLCLSYYTLS